MSQTATLLLRARVVRAVVGSDDVIWVEVPRNTQSTNRYEQVEPDCTNSMWLYLKPESMSEPNPTDSLTFPWVMGVGKQHIFCACCMSRQLGILSQLDSRIPCSLLCDVV